MIDIRTPQDFFAIIKRRQRYILFPLSVGVALSFAAALFWPPQFQSSAKILIQEPSVSTDITENSLSEPVNYKIEILTQRVMTTTNLESIITKFDLYPSLRQEQPIEMAIQKIRENIYWEVLNADVVDPRSSRPTHATIALQLAFNYGDARTAQSVLSELVKLFLDDDKRLQQQKVIDTLNFLDREIAEKQLLLNDLADQIAAFKQHADGMLPDQISQKLQTRDNTERNILEIDRQIQSLEEQRVYFQAQLAQIDRARPPQPGSEPSDPAARLSALQVRFAWLRSRYSAEHPDVLQAAQEIRELEAQVGGRPNTSSIELARQNLVSQLMSLRQKYSDDHPDIVSILHQIELLDNNTRATNVSAAPTNPAFIELKARLDATGMNIESFKRQRVELKRTIEKINSDLREAPEIERKFNKLLREYNTALNNLSTLSEHRTQAKFKETLELEDKLQQFLVLENPNLPIEPVKPNRLAIVVLGIIASIVIGFTTTFVVEFIDNSIYGIDQLSLVTNTQPLAVVPHIYTNTDIVRMWVLRGLYATPVLFVAILFGSFLARHNQIY